MSESSDNMRAIGVVRKTDEIGRYVLPKEIRRSFNLEIGDSLEIFVDDSSIILKKYEPAYIFCGEARGSKQL